MKSDREYVAAVIKACEERDTTHTKETEVWKQAIKTGDPEDPVVHLLEVTHRVVCAQAVRDVDTFLKKIKETLHKRIPVSGQGPLIANAMSTTLMDGPKILFQKHSAYRPDNKKTRPY